MPIGPSRPLNLAKPESIDIRQAARYFGARGEADSATLTLLEKCAAPLLAAATPRAVWLEADVESLTQAGILKGEDIFRHLEAGHQRHSSEISHQFEIIVSTQKTSFRYQTVPGFSIRSFKSRNTIYGNVASQDTFVTVLPEVRNRTVAGTVSLIMG